MKQTIVDCKQTVNKPLSLNVDALF